MEAIAAEKEIDKVLLQTKADSQIHNELFQLLREKEIAFQFVPIENPPPGRENRPGRRIVREVIGD